jgi:hypothetical protein
VCYLPSPSYEFNQWIKENDERKAGNVEHGRK